MNKEEQEKQALEILENTRQAWARIVNRYIKKLQKENTILQYNYTNLKEERKDCIHKDKIKDKIKELEEDKIQTKTLQPSKQSYKYAISVLKSLLEGE